MSSWKRNLLKDLDVNKYDYFRLADPWDLSGYRHSEPIEFAKRYHRSSTKIGPKEATENHKKAIEHFKLMGEWFEGCVLHHKDPSWRHTDIDRYNKWDPNDLEVMERGEHSALHSKLKKQK